jgi:hypothetical protein
MVIAAHAQEATTSGEGDAGALAEEERQEAATEEDELSEKIDAASGSLDDSIGSIEAGRETFGQNFKGDLRVGYTYTDKDDRDGSDQSESEWRGRFRAGGTFALAEKLVIGGRIASTCSTTECNPDLVFDSTLPNSSSIDDGDVTFDQLYIHAFRREKFDVAIGRLQTKFVSRAGVFSKSLDRDDSNSTNVNWTDGVHGVLHVNNEWTGHLILQKNQADGTGNIRRGPIDFNDKDSRISYFLAWENVQRLGPINQQGFDITYMPKRCCWPIRRKLARGIGRAPPERRRRDRLRSGDAHACSDGAARKRRYGRTRLARLCECGRLPSPTQRRDQLWSN